MHETAPQPCRDHSKPPRLWTGPKIAVYASSETTCYDKVKILTKEKVKVLADQNGWTIAYAEGYVDGERSRRRGLVPSKSFMVGIDDYCLGFRAGYFAADRKPQAAKHASK